MRRAHVFRAVAMVVAAVAATPAFCLPDDAAVRAILAQRIAQKQGVGFAVVLLDDAGTRIVTAGVAGRAGNPVTADTEFEIGSITKTFTGLMLADAVLRDVAKLDDPVAALLPAPVPGLVRDGKPVTLVQLASHRSGLPPLPDNMAPMDATNPFAGYDGARLMAFLGGNPLQRISGERYEYSNLGGGTLGYALTQGSGGYDATLRARVLVPLGMTDTGVELSTEQQTRLATGHGRDLEATPSWTMNGAFAGAGASAPRPGTWRATCVLPQGAIRRRSPRHSSSRKRRWPIRRSRTFGWALAGISPRPTARPSSGITAAPAVTPAC